MTVLVASRWRLVELFTLREPLLERASSTSEEMKEALMKKIASTCGRETQHNFAKEQF